MSTDPGSADATVRIERVFRAPVGRVFEAWTSERVLRRWWHAAHDWETPEATLDLRVGGAIRISMRDPGSRQDYGGSGEFTIIDPPRRLAFTWIWDEVPDTAQLIEVEFTDLGEETKVVLTNGGIPTAAADDHYEGWINSLDNLAAALE